LAAGRSLGTGQAACKRLTTGAAVHVGHFVAGKKVLVTGASGFVGGHLTRRLVELDADVRIFRRETATTAHLDGLALETHIGDLRDGDSVRRAVADCDLVFHVAAVISYWRGDRDRMVAVNVEGTDHVIQACMDADVSRLVHTSSIATIGIPPFSERADETQVYAWDDHDFAYMSTKFAAERNVLSAADELDVVVVNPSLIFGPGSLGTFGPLLSLMKRGWLPFYPYGGCNFIDVKDVVEGHLLAAEKGRRGERYILGGDNLSWREFSTLLRIYYGRKFAMPIGELTMRNLARIAGLLAHLTGKKPLMTAEMVTLANLDLYYDCQKAADELGFHTHPLAERLYETLAWYEEHGFDGRKG
jgi:dihydroflavonol-4-reductase